MLRFMMPLIGLALCFGCQDKRGSATPSTRAKAKAEAAAQADPAVLKRLDALGDGGLLVGVLDARGWAKVHQRLTPIFAKLPGQVSQDWAKVAELPGLLNNLYKGLWGGKTPLDLSALDANGAITVSLFEPATFGPPGSSAAHISFDGQGVPLRHEIVLPATDASALAAALSTGMKGACKPAAHGCDFGVLQIGIKADGDVVRIAALMPATVEDASTMLWRKPQSASVRTPAYTQLAMPGAGLGLLIRPWRVRAMFAQEGINAMAYALREAPADMRHKMFAQGLAIVLNGVQLMHAERPDFEDAVVRLVADDAGVAFEGTHALTAGAAKAFKDAMSKGGRTLALKLPVIAQTAQRIDFNALLDGVGPRPIFAKMKRMRDFVEGLRDCGFGCVLHAVTRVPLSTARGALDFAPAEVKAFVRALPTAMQSALVRLDPGLKPIAALAGDVAKDFDTGQLRALAGAEVHLIPKDDRAVLLVGLGIDPRTVFDVQATTTPQTASTARIEPTALQSLAELLGAGPVKPLFDALGPIVADSAVAPGGHAFAWRIHLSTSPGVNASPFAPVATAPFGGPILGFTPSAGDRCLGEVAAGMSAAFLALSHLSPEKRVEVVAKGFAELAPSFKCADSSASTQAAAMGMRRLFVHTLGMGARPGETDALTFIDAQCVATKDPAICAEAKRIKALPPPLKIAPPSSPFGAPMTGLAIDSRLTDVINTERGVPLVEVAPKVAPSSAPDAPSEDPVGTLPEMKGSLLTVPETRDKTLIQFVLRSKIKQVRYCYEKALAKNPALTGKAMLSFTITPAGDVSDAVSTGETLPPDVHTCIAKRTKNWGFLPAKTETKVNYPFVFKSK